MAKWIIKIKSDTELAKKILPGWQYKFFKIKQMVFLRIMKTKLKKECTEVIDKKQHMTFILESDDMEYLEDQKNILEEFVYSDYSTFASKNEEFKHLANDRIIQKVNKSIHKLTAKAKDKAMKTALKRMDALGFFNRLGIIVSWKIETKPP